MAAILNPHIVHRNDPAVQPVLCSRPPALVVKQAAALLTRPPNTATRSVAAHPASTACIACPTEMSRCASAPMPATMGGATNHR